MFLSDEPVSALSQDLLQRKPFAEAVGSAILSHTEDRSLVLGLHGPWGSGKSSVLRMTKDYLEQQTAARPEAERPIVVTFNPWLVADQNALIQQFFDHFLAALGRWNVTKARKHLARYLHTYSSLLAPAGLVPSAAGGLAGVASKGLGVVARLAAWWQRYADSVEGQKEKLDGLLGRQPHRVIFLIDEIDRLTAGEARIVFQVVKSIANFPKTVYVLAFDRKIVAAQLQEQYPGEGEAFLDKIVQVPFEIPAIPAAAIDRYARSALKTLLEPVAHDTDQDHMRRVVQFGLRPYLRDFRIAKRFLNVAALNLTIHRGRVRPSDLIGISVLQVFEPEVFSLVRASKHFLTAQTAHANGVTKSSAVEQFNAIVKPQRIGSEVIVGNLIQLLFPKAAEISGQSGEKLLFETDARWRVERRICDPVVFDHVFTASLPPGEFTPEELGSILSQCSAQDLIEAHIQRVISQSRSRQFLEHLHGHVLIEQLQPGCARNLIAALVKHGDGFKDTPMDDGDALFRVDLVQFAVHIIKAILAKYFGDNESGLPVVQLAIEQSPNSFTVPYLLNMQVLRESEGIKAILMSRARAMLESGAILQHPRIGMIANWAESNGAKDLADAICGVAYGHDDALLSVICEYASPHDTPRPGGGRSYVLDIVGLRTRLDLRRIYDRLRDIAQSGRLGALTAQEQLLVKAGMEQLVNPPS